jgi:hypothetical protein
MMQGARALSNNEAVATLCRAQRDPVWWVESVTGFRLWSKQQEILRALADPAAKLILVATCQQIGKSMVGSAAFLWWLATHADSKPIITAPKATQVEQIAWQNVRTLYQRARERGFEIGTEPGIAPKWELAPGWVGLGMVADPHSAVRLLGFNSLWPFVLVDEAVGVARSIWESVLHLTGPQNGKVLALTNPIDASSYFAQLWREHPSAIRIRVSAYDSPNFAAFGITEEDIRSGAWREKQGDRALPYPAFVAPATAADYWTLGGKRDDDPVYQSKILASFPERSEHAIVPLAWLEDATHRRNAIPADAPSVLGVDVAGEGGDETIVYHRHGARLRRVLAQRNLDRMALVGRVVELRRELGAHAIHVDAIGIGDGVAQRLKELGEPVRAINVAEAALDRVRFVNLRAELAWLFREHADPHGLADLEIDGAADRALISQASSVRWSLDSHGRRRIESKDDLRRRIGRSPDDFDAACLALAPVRAGGEVDLGLGDLYRPSQWRGKRR